MQVFQHIDCECFQNTRKEHIDVHDMISFGKDKNIGREKEFDKEKDVLRIFHKNKQKTKRRKVLK